ncbi:MAG TPA: hypothetical protein VLF62_06615 [Candidatus Saccharimonadales bacterium]|nr:hypothetical protein [Candidatus Saccharimonadales bacterium]
MSNQVAKALSGEQARNHSGGYDVAPEVARAHELDQAAHEMDVWRATFDPQPIAATAMSTQIENHPQVHATTPAPEFENIMNANDFDPTYLDAISGAAAGATMPADTPRPAPVEAQQNQFQQYQGV